MDRPPEDVAVKEQDVMPFDGAITMQYDSFVIAGKQDKHAATSHAFCGGGCPQCFPAQSAVEVAVLRSGVRSRSGKRVMCLDGRTENYTGQLKTPTASRTGLMATAGTNCTRKVTGQGVQ